MLSLVEKIQGQIVWGNRAASNRNRYARNNGRLIKISHAVYLSRAVFTPDLSFWEMQSMVAIARILATVRRMEDIVFCKDTALFLHGVPQKIIPTNVYVRSDLAYGKHVQFPAVWIGEQCVLPAGKVRVSHATLTHHEECYASELPCVSLVQALVDCVVFKGDEEALASASALLSFVARRRGVPREYAEAEAEKIRGQALLGVKTREGLRGRQRTARLIEAASAKCDSVAEAYAVALLHEQGIVGWTQQHEVRTASGWRFIDFAFSEQRLAVEIEGKVKDEIVGRSTSEGHIAYYNRAAELSAMGWRVIPIPASDVLYNPMKARHTLLQALAVSAVAA